MTLFDILVTGCDNIVIISCLSWQCLFVYVCTYLAKRTNMALKHYCICINRIYLSSISFNYTQHPLFWYIFKLTVYHPYSLLAVVWFWRSKSYGLLSHANSWGSSCSLCSPCSNAHAAGCVRSCRFLYIWPTACITLVMIRYIVLYCQKILNFSICHDIQKYQVLILSRYFLQILHYTAWLERKITNQTS